jgi:hypothetical protein
MFGAVFPNEKMCMKTSHVSLNDNKDFIEESLLLTNHRQRGIDVGSKQPKKVQKEQRCHKMLS